jgi:hypothetical protein
MERRPLQLRNSRKQRIDQQGEPAIAVAGRWPVVGRQNRLGRNRIDGSCVRNQVGIVRL